MEDAFNITRYDRTDAELESFLLFAIAVAGKNAVQTDRAFEKLWSHPDMLDLKHLYRHSDEWRPLTLLEYAIRDCVLTPELLRQCGFGCYNHRFRSFKAAVEADINLRTCSPEDLEKIPGIGRKTSRFFILHSRKGARCAALDTHILKYLRDCGAPNVPRSTPSSAREYKRLEAAFLEIWARDNSNRWHWYAKSPLSVAEYDLSIWRLYTKNKEAA